MIILNIANTNWFAIERANKDLDGMITKWSEHFYCLQQSNMFRAYKAEVDPRWHAVIIPALVGISTISEMTC